MLVDGEPGSGVRLLPDGPHLARREAVPPEHLQEDKEGRMQCAVGAEIDSQVWKK